MEINNENQEQLGLWLVISVKNQQYAIDAGCVQSIFQLQQDVTRVPNCDKSIVGILKIRDDIVTIIDLRTIMGIVTVKEEQENFNSVLDQRKNDHIKWVTELGRCIEEKDEFKMATDPHKCAFGKWYDNFETDSVSIMHHLKKIDEPHRLLHETAGVALNCENDCNERDPVACANRALEMAKNEYMPKVLSLLDESKEIFEYNFRQMCVVVKDQGTLKGIVVDEVNSVEKLEIISDASTIYSGNENSMVTHIAQAANKNDQILIIDIKAMLSEDKTKL